MALAPTLTGVSGEGISIERVEPIGSIDEMGQLPPDLGRADGSLGVPWILDRYDRVSGIDGGAQSPLPYELQDVQASLRSSGELVVSQLVERRLVPNADLYRLVRIKGRVVLEQLTTPSVRFNWHENFHPSDTGVVAASAEDYRGLLLGIFRPE